MDPTYEYHRIARLASALQATGVPEDTARAVMEGGDAIRRGTSPEDKAAWLAEAMLRMDRVLDPETRQAVRGACACCLGGRRREMSKSIARSHESLSDRLAAANEAHFVFGHSVKQREDGQVLVRFAEGGDPSARCPCLPKARGGLSLTYCMCCGGHVKHHLQTALGRKLEGTVQTSLLSSGGAQACTFLFRILD